MRKVLVLLVCSFFLKSNAQNVFKGVDNSYSKDGEPVRSPDSGKMVSQKQFDEIVKKKKKEIEVVGFRPGE